jgi:hypothetical protein
MQHETGPSPPLAQPPALQIPLNQEGRWGRVVFRLTRCWDWGKHATRETPRHKGICMQTHCLWCSWRKRWWWVLVVVVVVGLVGG